MATPNNRTGRRRPEEIWRQAAPAVDDGTPAEITGRRRLQLIAAAVALLVVAAAIVVAVIVLELR